MWTFSMRARGRRSAYGAAAANTVSAAVDIDRQCQGAGTPPDAQVKRAAAREQAAVERSPGCGGYGGGAEELAHCLCATMST